MDHSISAQAEQLFLEARELDPAERTAFLQRTCADDSAVRREVEALLEAYASAAAYFDSLPERFGIARLVSGDAGAERPSGRDVGKAGQEFGQYRLTNLIGSGGMGTVWRAARSDGRFEGNVAVKLLSHSAGGAAPERFALEGRYLAKLTHPNIARLLDAGVGPNEQPYLVLEFVNGLPIDQYCDEHSLDIEQRIRLFLAVLDAVAHAHARLIVHRDIKPSNVQVDTEGTVKLLDFGVAKLLGEDAVGGGNALTREVGAALTPEYAAPEQLNGETITTATDIYSLGLLLWLLVTGSNQRNTAEVRSLAELRALVQKEPTRLLDAVTGAPALDQLARVAECRNTSSSDLLKALRSDLDNIVRKALAVEPRDRYQTVADFAQDLTRYLRNEPVIAQAQTIRYRAQKFLRRHRGGVLAASLTVLALIAAAAVTTWQSLEAQRQRDMAIYQQQRAQATNEFLTVLLSEVGSGDEPLTLVDLLDRGTAMLDRQFGADDRFIARTLYSVSNFYGRLGRVDRQLELLQRAESIARDLDDHHLLGLTSCAQARVQRPDDPEAATRNIALGRAALATLRDPPWDIQGECYRAEALVLEASGDREAAIAALQAALNAANASPTPSGAARAVLLNDLSEQYYKTDRANEALAMNAELLEIMDRIGRGGTIDQVIYLINRAAILSRMGEMVDAAVAQQEALARIGQLEAAGHIVVAARGHYANTLLRLARYEEALELFTSGREAAADSGNTRWVAQGDLSIGITLARLGRNEEAENHLSAAEAIYRDDPGANARLLEELSLARARMRLGDGDIDTALEIVNAVLQRAGYPQRKDAPGLSSMLWTASQVALAAGDAASAEQYANDGYENFLVIARNPALSADVGQLLLLRAKAREAQGDRPAAVADLQRAITSLVNGFGEDHPETREARELMALAGR